MGTVLTKRKFLTKHRTRKHRGGGGAGSKLKRQSVPKPTVTAAIPVKRVVLFDLDGTLLFRTEVTGVWSLQQERMRKGQALPGETSAITVDKVRPCPDILFPELQEIVYVRPDALDALDLARATVGPENVHVFTASSNPEYVITPTGIAEKVNMIFDRKWTEGFLDRNGTYVRRGSFVALKDFAAVRKTLGLKPTDVVYLFDDHPEWIKNVSANDHVISVPAFTPAYELYGVLKTHAIVPDAIPSESTLLDVVRAMIAA